MELVDEHAAAAAAPAPFACGIGGCAVTCSNAYQFQTHFESAHRHVCATCERVLPTDRMLGLHVVEAHDSYFRALASRQPSYECYVEGCAARFLHSRQRREHLIAEHEFVPDAIVDTSAVRVGRAAPTSGAARRGRIRV